MIDPDLLTELPLTRPLTLATRQALARHASIRRYAAGEVLWTAGTPLGHLAVVLEGRVRVVREGRGRQHVLHTEGPGGTLGEVPLFTGGPTPATAIAAESTRCLILTQSTIAHAMEIDPEVAWLLLRRMAQRVRLLVERLDRLALESARTRLASLLLTLHEESGSRTIDLGMTQTALAEELGTVREVVVRMLRSFRDEGLVATTGRGRLELLDVGALRGIVVEDHG